MRIIFSGGGTLGPVMPLISVIEELKKDKNQHEFLWVGTYKGPEKKVVADKDIKYKAIMSTKLRRYFSLKNLLIPFKFLVAFYQSVHLILKFGPQVIVSAGGYNSVPLVWAASVFKIPVLIHQQDIIPGLANKLMAPFAETITVTFEKSLKDFDNKKTVLTGNPIRNELFRASKQRAINHFDLEKDLPTVLFVGGGTGALHLNKIIVESVPQLTRFCQIIHITGKGKKFEVHNPRYHAFEFLSEWMGEAFEVADVVVCRAGLSTLSEVTTLAKPTIIIPMPNSHQEYNAKYFYHKDAALMLDQENIRVEDLISQVKRLIDNKEERERFSQNMKKIMPRDSAKKIAKEISNLVG